MTIPTLSDEQRRALGKIIWTHIDGVAENVTGLLGAINRDLACGVRVVATHEWEKASDALRAIQAFAHQLEERSPEVTLDRLVALIRDLAMDKGPDDRAMPDRPASLA